MNKHLFGDTGFHASEVGLGCWQLGGDCWGDVADSEAMGILRATVDGGVNFLDTADVYGNGRSEELIGKFLRERPEDLPQLLSRFCTEFCHKYDMKPRTFTTEAIDHLRRLQWPGNIRELRNFTERTILLSQGDEIEMKDIEQIPSNSANVYNESIFACTTFEEFKQTSERLFLEKKLNENEFNIKRTAEALGMQRSNLYKKIDRYNLK